MTKVEPKRRALRHLIVEAFAVANLALLGFDVALAHWINDFAHPAEWAPVIFSAIAALLLLPGLPRWRYHRGLHRQIGILVGAASIAVGIVGMFPHLDSTFFAKQSLANLVYTAPFAAPLGYSGAGFPLLLNRMEPISSASWGFWVIFLAMAGFVGALAVSLGDHAQNGFFERAEWIPVVAAAMAASFLLTAILRPDDPAFWKLCLGLMALQVIVGVLGFGLHARANLAGVSESFRDNFVFGAPVFAPLLFADLALLAAIGLWDGLDEEVMV